MSNPEYSKGYAAGRRRGRLDRQAEQRQLERQAFLDRAFLAVLPSILESRTWQLGDKPAVTVDDRVKVAWGVARRALAQR